MAFSTYLVERVISFLFYATSFFAYSPICYAFDECAHTQFHLNRWMLFIFIHVKWQQQRLQKRDKQTTFMCCCNKQKHCFVQITLVFFCIVYSWLVHWAKLRYRLLFRWFVGCGYIFVQFEQFKKKQNEEKHTEEEKRWILFLKKTHIFFFSAILRIH